MLQNFLQTGKVPDVVELVSEDFSISEDELEVKINNFFTLTDHHLEKNEQMSGKNCGCFHVKKHHNKKEIVASISYTNIHSSLSRVTLNVYQLS